MSFIEWVSLISGFCSIIALPIAIWQIFGVKNKIKSTENGIKQILGMQEHKRLEQIKNILNTQHGEISTLQSSSMERGSTKSSMEIKLRSVINELNQCIYDVPSKYNGLTDVIHSAVNELHKYCNGETNSLDNAEAFIYTTIQKLKEIDENYLTKEVENASKQT